MYARIQYYIKSGVDTIANPSRILGGGGTKKLHGTAIDVADETGRFLRICVLACRHMSVCMRTR